MATTEEIRGLGHSVKRKEDERFIRGKGTYVDDITLPGMLHLELLRSPFAHARITSIDTSRAEALIGFDPVPFHEGLRETFAWYRQQDRPAPAWAWEDDVLAGVR